MKYNINIHLGSDTLVKVNCTIDYVLRTEIIYHNKQYVIKLCVKQNNNFILNIQFNIGITNGKITKLYPVYQDILIDISRLASILTHETMSLDLFRLGPLIIIIISYEYVKNISL